MASILLLAACSGLDESDLMDEPNAPEELSLEDEEIVFGDPEEEIEEESVLLEDECLIGVWYVDHGSFANYLSSAMNQSEEVVFKITELSGDLVLSFDGDQMGFQTQSDQLEITMEIIVSDLVLGSATVSVNAFGEMDYYVLPVDLDPEFLSNILVSTSAEYEITGDGGFTLAMDEALTGNASISFTPANLAVTAINGDPVYDYIYSNPANEGLQAGYANYSCSDDEFRMTATTWSDPIIFNRH